MCARQTLAVRYRPKTFEDIVQQDAIKAILTAQLETLSFKQAYLFCGPAGCGKTTAARIFANKINEGKGLPIEVDAASNNGVDNVREIIENAKRKSLDSEYKVYIIDEVHMLSIGAFNALLKLIEEPPKSTVFIMCTTDPQKIPATILSRVQRYDFSKIAMHKIVERLEYILMSLNSADVNDPDLRDIGDIMREPVALEYIAKLADGGMRDAITLLDKCLSFSSDITLENVVEALGTVNYATYFELLFMLTTGGVTQAIEIVETVYNAGKDLKQFMKQFQFFVLDVCKFQLFSTFDYIAIPNLSEYEQLMEDYDYDKLLVILDWARSLNTDIKWESNIKAVVESCIILICKEIIL